ncbi:hypothetical protein Q7P37_009439 [Cladosporium fusiforme]
MSSEFKLQDTKGDDWSHLAEEYKKFSNGPATIAIETLLKHTNSLLPFSRATAILDNGCGPGPVISRLITAYNHELPQTTSFLAADFSEGMIAQVEASKRTAIAAGGPESEIWSRVETRILDATDMKSVPDASQSHVLAGWVYFMTPDPQKCLTESLRVLQPGGVLACTAWESSQWLTLMYTLSDVRPDLSIPSLPKNWSDLDLLRGELETAGFREAKAERVAVKMQFEKHETLVDWLIEKLPHAIALTKQMSVDEVKQWKEAATRMCKQFCPEAPGELSGWSLMASGRK